MRLKPWRTSLARRGVAVPNGGTGTILTRCRFRLPGEAAPAHVTAAVIGSASGNGWPHFLVPPDPWGSLPPLGWGEVADAQPLSAPLPGGLRFLPRLVPAAASATLARGLPR